MSKLTYYDIYLNMYIHDCITVNQELCTCITVNQELCTSTITA